VEQERDHVEPGADQLWPPGKLFELARLAATIGALLLCGALIFPFLAPLTWGLVLAMVFAKPHRSIEIRTRRPNLAAALSVFIVAIIIVAPLLFVTERMVKEVMNGATFLQEQVSSGQWRALVDSHPWMKAVDSWVESTVDLQGLAGKAASWLTNAGAYVVRSSTSQVADVFLAFYFLFFFLKDRRVALETIKTYSPFSDLETQRLFVRIRDTIEATIYGTLVVACLQGGLGGLMFWWLGFPSPMLWAVVMGIVSVIPVVGCSLVWAPAAIFLVLDGRWGEGLLVTGWGALVIGTVDNFVRPLLMGDRLRLHTAPTFISMLGGLQLLGASGLILGPVAVTSTGLLLDFWRRRNKP
jgi:predicted PurR-regulated permease PerM